MGYTPARDREPEGAVATEIATEDLHKAFDGQVVLRGIDLTVGRGELVAIVGPSGCGKTVLLSHVLGQLRPDRGRVRVADHSQPGAPLVELAALPPRRLDAVRRHWGVVFQRNALFSGSVFDNIALWLREMRGLDDEAIVPIARRVLREVALPDDDAFLARPAEQLSGGMAKRLAVARALAMDPAVVFYDEPTTGLDPMSASQIHELIWQTHEAGAALPRTSLVITHDKDLLARLQPRVVMLYAGRIAFDGPYAAFRTSRAPEVRPYFEQMPLLHRGDGRAGG